MRNAPSSGVVSRQPAILATAALAAVMAWAVSSGASAHRLDEYLQAARIDLRPDGARIELDLTPGAAVADAVITTIDKNGDGVTSPDEQHAYAGDVVRALEVKVDGASLPLRLASSTFPALAALRRGEGTIRLEVSTSHPPLAPGTHALAFSNTHAVSQSVYLANALVPESDRISVSEQRRDVDQRQLTIAYSVRGASARVITGLVLLGVVVAVLLARFALRRHAAS